MSTTPNFDIGDIVLDGSGWLNLGEPELPNKKFKINVHQAHGGYIVEISTDLNSTGELYIVSEEKDLGQEIGNIITHKILNAKHE
jgi:hypothetical protein